MKSGTAKAVYDHLKGLYTEIDAARASVQNKAQSRLATICLIFGAIVYEFGRFNDIETPSIGMNALAFILAGIATIVTAAAFIHAIKLSELKPVNMVGYRKLKRMLDEQQLSSLSEEDTFSDLAANYAIAIKDNEPTIENCRSNGLRSNRLTIGSLILVIAFVSYVEICCRYLPFLQSLKGTLP